MNIRNSVIVITGGSSGIGHATALALAKKGARIVLAARGVDALARVVDEINSVGGEAVAVPTDVSRPHEVQELAAAALARFGRIDCWINNASVATWSTIEEMTAEEASRVIDVNLLGTIYGVKAALPAMLEQGRGVIINVASVLAERSIPLLSTYCAAKHGVKGFTESLRMEVSRDGIKVVLVLPSAINTPFYTWGRSKMGVRPDPVSIVYDPRVVARAIVRAVERPRRDVYVGGIGRALALGQRLSPRAVDAYMQQNGRMWREQITNEPDHDESNLYRSPEESSIDGKFVGRARRRSVYTEVTSSPGLKGVLALFLIAAGAALWSRTSNR
jgi:short-subunit dehydrogenase